ncbi:MAG: patatin-like phospholipase family protein [Dehalococcoidia bacterium]|nr:patatin-like phospholipase family protein [Dehalococcoidia bacterium]MDD5493099.1 patatin-like phospholipase family protein [Dehalococcoidia bacterium]
MTDVIGSPRKIGLALGSGAAKGIAHIGVIKALREADIPIDLIAGTSMGALVGACYAADAHISLLEEIALTSNLRKLGQLLDLKFSFLRSGVIQGGKVESFLKKIIGDKDFAELAIPFCAVATDIRTGNEVVINQGPLVKAVRASISIPAIFVPVNYDGRFLVDGGTTNPVPADVVRFMGATFTIAVNVLNDPKKRKHLGLTGDKKSNKPPSLINTLIQSLYIMEYEIIRASILKADIIIEPDVSHIEAYEFYRGAEAIEAGYKAAVAVIPEIKNLLAEY